MRRRLLDGDDNPRFIVTSLPSAAIDTRQLQGATYAARWEMENRIEECQLVLFADHRQSP